MRRHDKRDDGVATRQHAGRAKADYCPSNNERDAVLTHGADQAPDFEDANRDEEDELEVEVFVRFAPHGLRGADGQEHGRAVPANLLDVSGQLLICSETMDFT